MASTCWRHRWVVHRSTPSGASTSRAHPRVELQDGTVNKDYESREVFDDEKAIWWERAVATWPDYADYQKTTERQIPVFVLTPVS